MLIYQHRVGVCSVNGVDRFQKKEFKYMTTGRRYGRVICITIDQYANSLNCRHDVCMTGFVTNFLAHIRLFFRMTKPKEPTFRREERAAKANLIISKLEQDKRQRLDSRRLLISVCFSLFLTSNTSS